MRNSSLLKGHLRWKPYAVFYVAHWLVFDSVGGLLGSNWELWWYHVGWHEPGALAEDNWPLQVTLNGALEKGGCFLQGKRWVK